MAEKDYYKILGVDRNASKEEIKKAYKHLAKKFHPDLNKEAGAADKFKEINEAASVLADDKKKQHYDQFGTTAENMGGYSGFNAQDFSDFGFGNFDFDDIFESFFGGSSFGHQRRQRRGYDGADLHVDIDITLEEVYDGVKKDMHIERYETCGSCNGSGAEDDSSVEACQRCQGSGFERRTQRTPFGIFQTSAACSICKGRGKTIKHKCSDCKGEGRIRKRRNIEVSIPRGISEGNTLRVMGEGESGMHGGSHGNLYVTVHIEDHDFFDRRGEDIFCKVPISFVQATLGAEITVPTIKGKAKMKIPQGTQSHTVFRLDGEGLPELHAKHFGDQLVQVVVEVPRKLTKNAKSLIEELGKELGDEVEKQKGFFGKIRDKF